eukprot:7730442-Pyramimonas_sp.AAC.1
MSRSDIALAPLRALTGLSILRERCGFPRALPHGALDLSTRPSHSSSAGSPAGVDEAGVPAMAADSAISGICASAVGVVAARFDRAHRGRRRLRWRRGACHHGRDPVHFFTKVPEFIYPAEYLFMSALCIVLSCEGERNSA